MSRSPGRRPLKVCCVIGALTTGGSERQMIGILHQLDRGQFQPSLFTFYQHGPLVQEIPADVPHFCYEREVELPQPGWLPGRIHRSLSRRLAAYCLEHQIDLVYDRTFHVSLVTGAACRRSGTPYVNTVVENPYVGFYSTAGPFGRLKYYQLRQVYRRAATVICVSQGLLQATARFYGLPTSRFTCCYNFVDDTRLAAILAARQQRPAALPCPAGNGPARNDSAWAAAAPASATLGTAARPLRLIAVGRLHWQKGLDVLLKAIANLQAEQRLNVELDLVGDGPEESALRALTHQLGLGQRVRFLGWRTDPTPEIAASDLFILPSLAEGLPNSLLEAMLIGTPAIASNCDFGPAELAEHGKWATLVPPNNPQALAHAIGRFAKDPTADIARAFQAQTVLEQRFEASRGCQQLQAIWQRAVEGKSSNFD